MEDDADYWKEPEDRESDSMSNWTPEQWAEFFANAKHDTDYLARSGGKRKLKNPDPSIHKETTFNEFLNLVGTKKLMPYYVVRIFEWGKGRITFSLVPYEKEKYKHVEMISKPPHISSFGPEFLTRIGYIAEYWFDDEHKEYGAKDRPDYFDILIYGIDKNNKNNVLFGEQPQEGYI